MYIGNGTLDPQPLSSRYPFLYHRKFFEAAGALSDTARTDEAILTAKIRRLWVARPDYLTCNNTQFEITDGSLIKFAATSNLDRFIADVAVWGVGTHDYDDYDRQTVVDYITVQIYKNRGTALAATLLRYYTRLREWGYRHYAELPANVR